MLRYHSSFWLTNMSCDEIYRNRFKIQSNIWDGAFCGNSWGISAANYFRKKVRHRCVARIWIRLWSRMLLKAFILHFRFFLMKYVNQEFIRGIWFPNFFRLYEACFAEAFEETSVILVHLEPSQRSMMEIFLQKRRYLPKKTIGVYYLLFIDKTCVFSFALLMFD